MRTYISDNFPLTQLECQFFDECQYYIADQCKYGEVCSRYKNYQGKKQTVRKIFKDNIEKYIEVDNLKFQIGLIINDGKK